MFELGQVVATPGLLRLCTEQGISPVVILERHARLDGGDLGDEDRAENARAIREGSRIFSAYTHGGEKVFVITEADRSSTCLLLADDY